jgi:hypothetical protein
MKGDFTRFTHQPAKGFSAVLRQQGRVDLDADWNEQVAIQDQRAHTLAMDVIGPTGVPKHDTGFEVSVAGADIGIAGGRIWVDGILCELPGPVLYGEQMPEPEALTDGDDVDGRTDLVYLDVWQRHVSAIEDPELLDPALNGLDTTTRLQTVFRVRVLQGVGDIDSCADVAGFPPPHGGARLTSAAVAAPAEEDPCDVVVAGGYRGVENRLYRVEVHDGGAIGGATWKWSRDNGAVAFRVEEFLPAPANRIRLRSLGRDRVLTLRQDDWVEILDDANELGLEPGLMARVETVDAATRIITLDRDVPAGVFDVGRNARVRRWDHVQGIDPDTGTLLTEPGPIDLEDGVQVSFGGGDFRSGDWWAFAARTAGGTIEELDDAEPHGIAHHYAPLALIRWSDAGGGDFVATLLDDCRPAFPPLTDICADDVCYQSDTCDLDATTVQEALDELCRARDLRFHNRHLHGWGIVCGLKVVCGPTTDNGERHTVTLRPGYAIDCDGTDVLVDEDISVDVLAQVAELDEAEPDTPILDGNGNGEVCLVLERNGNGPQVRVERLQPQQDFLQRLLAGTLLKDFYDHCIRRLVEFVQAEFTAGPDEQDELVGPTQRRITSFLNLLIQFFNPANGRYVHLSEREHELLLGFYTRLRNLLASETFCAMYENARPFPDYPFRDEALNTIFGKGFHTRLRVDPDGARGYTVGAGTAIHVYDLETEEMVARLEFPGGTGALVRDVAFSEDGRQLHGIATLNDDTVVATADIDGGTYRFRPANVVCGIELVTLATVPGQRNIFAIGRGSGLYEINPDAVTERLEPRFAFNASGHLVIPPAGPAFATANAPNASPDTYDRVVRMPLGQGPMATYQLRDVTGAQRTGQDDIAVRRTQDGGNSRLYVVAGAGTSKQILVYDANPSVNPPNAPLASPAVENTGIRLALLPDALVIAFEDSYRLGLLDLQSNAVVMLPGTNSVFRHPVQISPRGLATDLRRERLYVLNFFSNTISRVDLRYLRASGQLDLDALAQYRQGIINAFLDLFGQFLQYLKDCFCDRFLVDCPECTGEERIYLACASIRGRAVYQVCNFSRRKYVKSFPTVEYWLSVVPVIPLVREAVAKFCCAVLPDLFGRIDAPQGNVVGNMAADENRLKATHLQRGVSFGQGLDLSAARRTFGGRADVLKTLTGDWLAARPAPAPPAVAPQPALNQVVGQRVEVATAELERAGVQVAAVEAYDPAAGRTNILSFAKSAGRIPTDRPLTLYEEDGVVKYYSVATPPTPEATVTEVSRLNAEVVRLTGALTELAQARDTLIATRNEVATLRVELDRTRKESGEALAAREREITELRKATETVRADVRTLETLRKDVDRIMRER